MKKAIIIILTIIGGVLVKSQTISNNNKWKYDLIYLKDSLPYKHINLYFKISQHEFNSKIDSLILKLNSKSDDDILLSIQEIIAKIGDSHTSISWHRRLKDKRILPVKFGWFSNGIFIIETEKQYHSLLGCKVLSIGNMPIDSVVAKFQNLIVPDNDAIVKQKIPNLLRYAILYEFYNLHKKGDTIVIKTQNKQGKMEPFKIGFIDKEKSLESIKLHNIPLYLRNTDKLFWHTKITADSLIYVQYNKCQGKEVLKIYKKIFLQQFRFPIKPIAYVFLTVKVLSSPSFKKFSRNIYKDLNTNSYRKIILDIRFNEGGSSMQGSDFIDSISKFKNVSIYGIIGRSTFSSGLINAIDLKNKNAVLIGENTSGMAKHYGEVKFLCLPKTNLQVSYSTNYFDLSDKYTNTVFPDVKCELTFDDYVNGIDPCMDFIVEKH